MSSEHASHRINIDRLFDLTGRIALVTGSSRGLGTAMAGALASAGVHVFLNSRDPDRVATLVEQFRDEGLKASPLAFDVENDEARDAAIATIAAQAGRLDILVNSAASRLRGTIEEIEATAYLSMLESHLVSAYALARLAIPMMRRQAFGRIVNLTSISATLGRAGDAAYISAKGGVAALTRALACEAGPEGITVNAISPGIFLTDVNRPLMEDEHHRHNIEARTPLRRAALPAEIGGAVLLLASVGGSFVNGHVLTVDGGMSISV